MGTESDYDYLCIGICLPDEDEAYCIGCGRPWGTANVPPPAATPPEEATPPAPDIDAH
jgi:hypothetical protein